MSKTSSASSKPADVKYGYLSREYADRHLGAFRLQRPLMLDSVSLSVDSQNHSFALIGKRAQILNWLSQEKPNLKVNLTETYSWRKTSPHAGLMKVTVRPVHVGYRFVYLLLSKKFTNKLLVEFSPWDGKVREDEPMPLDKDEIDAIPLKGEAVLIRSGTELQEVATKLITKRQVMDEAGGIKVMGIRLERASTFSSVHKEKSPDSGETLLQRVKSFRSTNGTTAA